MQADDDAVALACVADAVEDAVALVLRLAGDVHLRDQRLTPRRRDGKVDVRGAPRIGNGLDSAEAVGALGVGGGAASTLEAAVALAEPVRVARMAVDAGRVALPDFDRRTRDRRAGGVEHTAEDMRQLPLRLRRLADDAHEIVVGVAGPVGRVERPLGLRRRGDELLLGGERGAAEFGTSAAVVTAASPRTTWRRPKLRCQEFCSSDSSRSSSRCGHAPAPR